MQAYSTTTGETYPSWEELVEAEANGWLCIALITGAHKQAGKTWPFVEGPFPTKREAENARSRMRGKFKREAEHYPGQTYKFFVRPAWKAGRER